MDAYLFTHRLHQASRRKGLRVFDRTNIQRIQHQRRGIKAVTAEGHTIQARYAVYATGYETTEMLLKKIARLRSTYVIISEPTTHSHWMNNEDVMVWNTAQTYLSLHA